GIKKEKINIIHNWAEGTAIYPINKEDSQFYNEWGLNRKFVILYSGNLGVGHEFETILKTAYKLNIENRKDILFLFIGEGSKKRVVENFIKENQLTNIILKTYVPKEDLRDSLAVADIHLITQTNEVVGVNMPSKLYGCMASGRPIIYIGPKGSDVAKIIEISKCGFTFSNGQIEEVYNKLKELSANSEVLYQLGQNARDYFERYFDRSIAIEKYYQLIHSVYEQPDN
ncbi:MAG: glycosyltransferase family 4 protein, partial [Myxococcota bacterium]